MEGNACPKDKWETIHRHLPSEDFLTNHFDVDNEGNFYEMYKTYISSDPVNGAKNKVDEISNKFYALASKKIQKDAKVRFF